MKEQNGGATEYWKKNRFLIAILLAIWALVSYVFAILMAGSTYDMRIGKLHASFWWAQQRSMFEFVILILVNALVMDRLDRKYDVHDDDDAVAGQ